MRRLLVLYAFFTLLVIPACTQEAAPGPRGGAVPITLLDPLRGVVTIIAPYGQFYTNIGLRDGLYEGAELLILRRGLVIAQADVIEIGYLDAVAQLRPQYATARLRAGDNVVVRRNPPPPPPPERPFFEPDLRHNEDEFLAAILLLIGIGLTR